MNDDSAIDRSWYGVRWGGVISICQRVGSTTTWMMTLQVLIEGWHAVRCGNGCLPKGGIAVDCPIGIMTLQVLIGVGTECGEVWMPTSGRIATDCVLNSTTLQP
jgi:hypothetical protein